MNKILKSVGAALLYILIYPLCQIVVTNGASIIISAYMAFKYGMEMGLADESVIFDAQKYMSLANDIAVKVMEILYAHIMGITLISAILAFVVYFLMFSLRKKSLFKETGIVKTEVIYYPLAVVLGIAFNVFVVCLITIAPLPAAWLEGYADATAETGVGGLNPIAVITTVVAAPIIEEIVYRGLFYTRLKSCMPMLGAMILSSFIFGIMHGTAIVWVAYAAVLGFVLSWVYEKSGSLVISILLHMGFNAVGAVSELLPSEINAGTMLIMGAVSGAAVVLLMSVIQLRSKNKIEVAMPDNTVEHD